MNIIYHKTRKDPCASFVWFIPNLENDEAGVVRDLSCSSGVHSPGSVDGAVSTLTGPHGCLRVSVLGVSHVFLHRICSSVCVFCGCVIARVVCLAVLCRSSELLEDKDLVLAVLVPLTSFAQVFPRGGLN